jgi:two-component system, OmpR family, sensor kinase
VSIKGRIRALQVMISLIVAVMAAIVFVGLDASTYYLDRAQLARQQLAATSDLAIYANRYSEQIAELLLVGEPERPDFDSARVQVGEALAKLRQTTEREAEFVLGRRYEEEEQVESERLDRMQLLFAGIDRAFERLLVLDRQGRREEAVALFRAEIENRLDAEFAQLINEALADERDEVRQIEADLVRLAQFVKTATLSMSAILVALALGAGYWFARSIERPIKALTDGALAIERGDLDHRITVAGSDEHALLSQRFNAMAEQLGRQRAVILDAQQGLARQVAERTEELAEANRRLVATDEQRVRLLTDISHELRTPLTALRGEAEIALRGGPKSERDYKRALTNVVARAEELARLVADLLFLARSESEDIRFDLQPADLAELVRQVAEQARVLGRERGIEVSFSPAGPVWVRADPGRLQQAILIALDNAVKYSDPGTTVDVALGYGDGDVELRVRDHGKGVAAEDLPHIFERFYRGSAAREQWSGGTGLGLPIARWIIERHGGSITLSSTAGEGSEVVIRLPGAD